MASKQITGVITGIIDPVWTSNWARTILIGIIAGIPFGLLIQFWLGNMIDVGALYGEHSVVRGWIAHLFHSVAGAVVFAGIVRHARLENHVTAPSRRTALGVVYGLVLWVLFVAVILPIWLDIMTRWGGGTPLIASKLRFPASFIGFLVYGVIVAWGVRPAASVAKNQQDESGTTSDNVGGRRT